MSDRYNQTFVALLQQWGAWAAGRPIQGYDTGHRGGGRSFWITDEVGLVLDHAIARVRQRTPFAAWRLFELYYRAGYDCDDIVSVLRDDRRYAAGHQTDYGRIIWTLDRDVVALRVDVFGRMVFEELRNEEF
jgi:hypothetical protein